MADKKKQKKKRRRGKGNGSHFTAWFKKYRSEGKSPGEAAKLAGEKCRGGCAPVRAARAGRPVRYALHQSQGGTDHAPFHEHLRSIITRPPSVTYPALMVYADKMHEDVGTHHADVIRRHAKHNQAEIDIRQPPYQGRPGTTPSPNQTTFALRPDPGTSQFVIALQMQMHDNPFHRLHWATEPVSFDEAKEIGHGLLGEGALHGNPFTHQHIPDPREGSPERMARRYVGGRSLYGGSPIRYNLGTPAEWGPKPFDHAGFHAAMVANPRDATHSKVYADAVADDIGEAHGQVIRDHATAAERSQKGPHPESMFRSPSFTKQDAPFSEHTGTAVDMLPGLGSKGEHTQLSLLMRRHDQPARAFMWHTYLPHEHAVQLAQQLHEEGASLTRYAQRAMRPAAEAAHPHRAARPGRPVRYAGDDDDATQPYRVVNPGPSAPRSVAASMTPDALNWDDAFEDGGPTPRGPLWVQPRPSAASGAGASAATTPATKPTRVTARPAFARHVKDFLAGRIRAAHINPQFASEEAGKAFWDWAIRQGHNTVSVDPFGGQQGYWVVHKDHADTDLAKQLIQAHRQFGGTTGAMASRDDHKQFTNQIRQLIRTDPHATGPVSDLALGGTTGLGRGRSGKPQSGVALRLERQGRPTQYAGGRRPGRHRQRTPGGGWSGGAPLPHHSEGGEESSFTHTPGVDVPGISMPKADEGGDGAAGLPPKLQAVLRHIETKLPHGSPHSSHQALTLAQAGDPRGFASLHKELQALAESDHKPVADLLHAKGPHKGKLRINLPAVAEALQKGRTSALALDRALNKPFPDGETAVSPGRRPPIGKRDLDAGAFLDKPKPRGKFAQAAAPKVHGDIANTRLAYLLRNIIHQSAPGSDVHTTARGVLGGDFAALGRLGGMLTGTPHENAINWDRAATGLEMDKRVRDVLDAHNITHNSAQRISFQRALKNAKHGSHKVSKAIAKAVAGLRPGGRRLTAEDVEKSLRRVSDRATAVKIAEGAEGYTPKNWHEAHQTPRTAPPRNSEAGRQQLLRSMPPEVRQKYTENPELLDRLIRDWQQRSKRGSYLHYRRRDGRVVRYAANEQDEWQQLLGRVDRINNTISAMGPPPNAPPRPTDPMREAGRALARQMHQAAQRRQQPPTMQPSATPGAHTPLDPLLFRTLAAVHQTGTPRASKLAFRALQGHDDPSALSQVYAGIGRELQASGHHLANSYNWHRVGRGAVLDHLVEQHLAKRGIDPKKAHRMVLNKGNTYLSERATEADRRLHASLPHDGWHDRQQEFIRKFQGVAENHVPGASRREVRDAFVRAAMRAHKPFGSGGGQGLNAPNPRLAERHPRRYRRVRYARPQVEPMAPEHRETYNAEFRRQAQVMDDRVRADPSWHSLHPDKQAEHEHEFNTFMERDHFGHILNATRGDADHAHDVAMNLLYESPLFQKYNPEKPNLNARFGKYVKHGSRSTNGKGEMTFTDAYRDPEAASEALAGASMQSVDPAYRKRGAMGRTSPEDLAARKQRRAQKGGLRGVPLEEELLNHARLFGKKGLPWHQVSQRGYDHEAASEALASMVADGRLVSVGNPVRSRAKTKAAGAGQIYYLPDHAPENPGGIQARRERMKQMLQEGATLRDVAKEFGLSQSAAVYEAKKIGVTSKVAAKRAQQHQANTEKVAQVKELLQKGVSPMEAVRQVGGAGDRQRIIDRAREELTAEGIEIPLSGRAAQSAKLKEDVKRAVEMLRDGHPSKKIGQELGLTRSMQARVVGLARKQMATSENPEKPKKMSRRKNSTSEQPNTVTEAEAERLKLY